MGTLILIICLILILFAIKKDRLFVKNITECTCNSFYYHDENTGRISGGKLNCKIHKNE